jgi:hypothetical protein
LGFVSDVIVTGEAAYFTNAGHRHEVVQVLKRQRRGA